MNIVSSKEECSWRATTRMKNCRLHSCVQDKQQASDFLKNHKCTHDTSRIETRHSTKVWPKTLTEPVNGLPEQVRVALAQGTASRRLGEKGFATFCMKPGARLVGTTLKRLSFFRLRLVFLSHADTQHSLTHSLTL